MLPLSLPMAPMKLGLAMKGPLLHPERLPFFPTVSKLQHDHETGNQIKRTDTYLRLKVIYN